MVKTPGQIAADLDVLDLVLAHRDQVRVVGKDVRGHQHRIGEQAGVGGQAFRLFLLEGMATLQQSQRGSCHQQPRQLGHLRDVRLDEQSRPIRIQPQSEQIERGFDRVLPQRVAVAKRRQGVQVGDEVIRLVVVLEIDVLANRPKVIAPVKSARGLDSGKYSHVRYLQLKQGANAPPGFQTGSNRGGTDGRSRLGRCR